MDLHEIRAEIEQTRALRLALRARQVAGRAAPVDVREVEGALLTEAERALLVAAGQDIGLYMATRAAKNFSEYKRLKYQDAPADPQEVIAARRMSLFLGGPERTLAAWKKAGRQARGAA